MKPRELTQLVAPRSAASDRCEALSELLTLPQGGPLVMAGHVRLILRALHRPGGVELVAILPKGNWKTTTLGLATVEHLLVTPHAQAFIAADGKEQADEMYSFASHFAECDDEISGELLVRDGTREIRCARDRGKAKVLAADKSRAGGKKQAFNPTLFLCDELQAHENSAIYVAGRSGVFKRGGRMGTISTAGHDATGILGQRLAQIVKSAQQDGIYVEDLHVTDDGALSDDGPGRLAVAVSPSGRTVLLSWACRGEGHPQGPDDLSSNAIVQLANPAPSVTDESLDDARESLAEWDFARYRACVWTRGFRSWLPSGAWGAAVRKGVDLEPDGEPVFLKIDMARYSDTAALVAVQRQGEMLVAKALLIENSGGPDRPVDYELVKQAIRDANRDLPVEAVAFDPKYFDQAAEELEAEGVPMVLFPQSNERMGEAWPELRRLILRAALPDGETDDLYLVHAGGDPRFDSQVVSGRTKDLGENAFKVLKPAEHVHIDAGVALAGAAWLAVKGSERSVYEDRGLLILSLDD